MVTSYLNLLRARCDIKSNRLWICQNLYLWIMCATNWPWMEIISKYCENVKIRKMKIPPQPSMHMFACRCPRFLAWILLKVGAGPDSVILLSRNDLDECCFYDLPLLIYQKYSFCICFTPCCSIKGAPSSLLGITVASQCVFQGYGWLLHPLIIAQDYLCHFRWEILMFRNGSNALIEICVWIRFNIFNESGIESVFICQER